MIHRHTFYGYYVNGFLLFFKKKIIILDSNCLLVCECEKISKSSSSTTTTTNQLTATPYIQLVTG